MSAAGAFGMVRVNCPTLEGCDRVLHKPRFVERIGVNVDLNVELLADSQCSIDN